MDSTELIGDKFFGSSCYHNSRRFNDRALFGYHGSLISGNSRFVFLLALLVGGLTGLLLAFTSITPGVSQLVIVIGINILFVGLTGYFYRVTSAGRLTAVAPRFYGIKIPFLHRIPYGK